MELDMAHQYDVVLQEALHNLWEGFKLFLPTKPFEYTFLRC